MIRIELIDALGNGWDFEGEDIMLSVEGVTTLVIDRKAAPGCSVLGSFINVAGSKKEIIE